MTMTLWNLSSFDELDTNVLTAQGVRTPQKRAVTPGQYRSSAIKTAMQVAALAAVSYSVLVCGSSNVVGLPQNAAQSAVNVDPARTPLDELFRDRFDVSWTKEIEGSLLVEAAKKAVTPERDIY